MDHDAVATHVQNLMKFRTDAEEAINFYKALKAGGGSLPAAGATGLTDEQLDNLSKSLSDHLDGKIAEFGDRLGAIEDRLTALEHFKDSADQSITVVLAFKDEVSPLLEGLAGLKDMADWFADNREGLEVLLSLDGVPDEPAPKPEPEPAPQGDAASGGSAASGTAPLTLDQVDASSKPQLAPVTIPAALAGPQPDAAPAAAPQSTDSGNPA